MISYAALLGVDHLDKPSGDEVHEGDEVTTGPNPLPRYVVQARRGDQVWLRNPDNHTDAVVRADRCRLLKRAGA